MNILVTWETNEMPMNLVCTVAFHVGQTISFVAACVE